jgi:chromosome segregation ATPase
MSHMADPSSNSPRHLAGLASEYPAFEGGETAETSPDELSTLRDFNAKLLERISEIRRRNFELSKSDEVVREKEMQLVQLREQENKLRIKLSKLVDESWAKDLEIREFRETIQNENSELAHLRNESANFQKLLRDLQDRVAQSEKLIAVKEAEIRFISEERLKSIQELTEKHAVENSHFRELNHSLGEEIQKLSHVAQTLRERLANKETEVCEIQKSFEATLQLLELEKQADLQTFAQVENDLNEQIARLESAHADQSQQIAHSSSLVVSLEGTLGETRSELQQIRVQHEQLRRERDQAIESLRYQHQEKLRVLETDHAQIKADLELRASSLENQLLQQHGENQRLETLRTELEQEIEYLKMTVVEHGEALKSKSLELKNARDENIASLAQARTREEQGLAALDQKIELLRRQNEQDHAESQKQEAELKSQIRSLESDLRETSRQAIDANHLALNLKKELESAKVDLQNSADAAAQSHWETNQRHQMIVDQSRKRETDLTLELASLRTEKAATEKRLAESVERAAELKSQVEQQRHESRIELRTLREEAEKAFIEMQATLKNKMQTDFMIKFEAVLKENARLQGLLDVKDNSAEIERKELQKRQVHLNLLEQQLKSSANVLQSDRSRILDLSKQLATELQQGRAHPGAHTLRHTEERAHTLISIIKNLNTQI